jgi:hypothetical protein
VSVSDPNNVSDQSSPSIDTNDLNQFLYSVGSYTPELIYAPGAADALYHYTDLAGLQGIINKHDLWLTHSAYLNDEEEMKLGYKIAHAAIEAARAMRQDVDWAMYLLAIEQLLENPVSAGVYICCFCQEDNLLSQWRGYGANGTGVSIRLDPQQFSYITGPDSPHGGLMRLWRVFYKPETQSDIISKAINFAFDFPPNPASPLRERALRAARFIEFFVPTIKNPDFTAENEYRMIFTPPQNCPVKPQFRVGRGMLIPYYSLKELSGNKDNETYRLPITGVRVGPSVNKALNAESIQLLLNHAGYSDVRVDQSNTPYRG